ncbi:GNAT family N-acetyltransferase [Aliikangiella maris]|uniref:GNAT family N-acetyltransferase n=2 Tax=Aliikangiella maris TaxID=3162458 RepID=A0ABV3MT38_9GAMM
MKEIPLTSVPFVKVITAKDKLLIESVYQLRNSIFIEEQGIAKALDKDGKDEASKHLLIYIDDTVAATGRLFMRSDGVAELSRIAVNPQFRGAGLGKLVVEELEKLARSQNTSRMILHPHDYLESFYAQLGYRRVDGIHIVSGYKLITMAKDC